MTQAPQLKHNGRTDSLPRKKAKRFYQKKQPGQAVSWRTFRERYKEKKRKEHEQIVLDVYQSNPHNKPADLLKFLHSDYPLCEHNLRAGIIKVSKVLDHITPIRQGGAKFNTDNLQWVTEHYHNIKTGQEAHEET